MTYLHLSKLQNNSENIVILYDAKRKFQLFDILDITINILYFI